LNGKLLDGDGVEDTGFSASRSGVDCGESDENICVKLPGPELFGGSEAGKADGEDAGNEGAGVLGAGGGAALGVLGPSP
jgi:hypothetical protein